MATPAGTKITLTAGKLEPLVREETPNCTQLGVQLSISLPRLNDLKQQSRDKKPSKECFQEMLQQWLQDKDVDRKWCEIYEALDQQGNRRLKADLEKKYAADTRVDSDLGNFTKELRQITPKWYAFGVALGLSTTDLDIIEDEKGSQRYMINMLQEWMDINQEATWEALQEALRQIGNRRLAAKLDEYKLKDKQDTKIIMVSSKPKPKVEDDGPSSEKYGCKVFYQRRGVNTWKITFAVFPCDKSDKVKCNKDEQEGPSCRFDLETDTVKIAPKEQLGWSSKVTRKEVTKASVDAYTGAGKPPFCEITMTAASSQSTPPPLAMDVELEGPKPPKIMKLERKAENVSAPAPPAISGQAV